MAATQTKPGDAPAEDDEETKAQAEFDRRYEAREKRKADEAAAAAEEERKKAEAAAKDDKPAEPAKAPTPKEEESLAETIVAGAIKILVGKDGQGAPPPPTQAGGQAGAQSSSDTQEKPPRKVRWSERVLWGEE